MALSIANVIAWDFTSASSPLTSKIGQSETMTTGGSPTQDANGYLLDGANERLVLACTNGGNLTNWVYPYTQIIILERDSTGSNTLFPANMRRTSVSGGSDLIGMNANPSNGTVATRNNTGSNVVAWNNGMTNAALTVLVHTSRAGSHQLWSSTSNGAFVSRNNNTTGQPYTMPTLATTDTIIIGARDANNSKFLVKGMALVPGELITQDFTDLAADWKNALFGTAPAVAKSTLYFFLR